MRRAALIFKYLIRIKRYSSSPDAAAVIIFDMGDPEIYNPRIRNKN